MDAPSLSSVLSKIITAWTNLIHDPYQKNNIQMHFCQVHLVMYIFLLSKTFPAPGKIAALFSRPLGRWDPPRHVTRGQIPTTSEPMVEDKVMIGWYS